MRTHECIQSLPACPWRIHKATSVRINECVCLAVREKHLDRRVTLCMTELQDCGCMKKEWAYACGPDLSYTNVTAE